MMEWLLYCGIFFFKWGSYGKVYSNGNESCVK